jgi:hypothetical protein
MLSICVLNSHKLAYSHYNKLYRVLYLWISDVLWMYRSWTPCKYHNDQILSIGYVYVMVFFFYTTITLYDLLLLHEDIRVYKNVISIMSRNLNFWLLPVFRKHRVELMVHIITTAYMPMGNRRKSYRFHNIYISKLSKRIIYFNISALYSEVTQKYVVVFVNRSS